jgi:hypothetical protein
MGSPPMTQQGQSPIDESELELEDKAGESAWEGNAGLCLNSFSDTRGGAPVQVSPIRVTGSLLLFIIAARPSVPS